MREWRDDNGNEMKALVLDNGEICLMQVPDPAPSSGEALIKILKAGICNTDLEMVNGYVPFSGILGHEFVGHVEEASEKTWIGQRVVGEINIFCGICDSCRGGVTKHCSSRQVLGIAGKNGVFAEYLTLPTRNLHILPENVSTNEGAFAEPLAAALQILEQVKITKEKRVLVLGDGKLGLLVAQVLALESDAIFCVGKHERNLAILAKRGIQTFMKGEVLEPGFPLVVDATGNERGLETALQMVSPGGKVVLKSTFQGTPCFNISKVVVDEIHLIGSRCGPFPKAIDLLQNKRINVVDMIDGDYPLEHGLEAFKLAGKPGTLKILLTP
jgi:threonine dehydrogenase-like Zn-dependent dehydrogenase